MKNDNTYDLCFSLGEICASSQALREANLQFWSYPFDWATPIDSLGCARMLVSGFKDFLNREDFVYMRRNSLNGLGIFKNERTHFSHPHDFIDRPEIDDAMYAALIAKYSRRIERLDRHLRQARKVLAFSVCSPKSPNRDPARLCEIRETVLSRYPHIQLDFLVFQNDSSVPPGQTVESRPSEGIREVRFDYRNETTQVDLPRICSVLQGFGFRATDSRPLRRRAAFFLRGVADRIRRAKACLGASTLAGAIFARFVVLPVRFALARCRRKKYAHVLSLGLNCEIAFRQRVVWGTVESSLFNWGNSRSLANLIDILRHLPDLFEGELSFNDEAGMWICERSRFAVHGKLRRFPWEPAPGKDVFAADAADARGRVRHLREKFLRQISQDGKVLFVYALHKADLWRPSIREDLASLDRTLTDLGAGPHEILLVVEKAHLHEVPRLPGFRVRAIRAFNPGSDVTNDGRGDRIGWHAIFREFVPQRMPGRPDAAAGAGKGLSRG